MNILFTFPFVFNPQKGGTERVTDILAKEFKRREHNIFYLNMVNDPSKMDYVFPGEVSFIEEHPADYNLRSSEYVSFLKEKDIDVVINQGGVMQSCNFFCETGDSKAVCFTVVHSNPELNYHFLFKEISVLRNSSFKEKIKRLVRILYFPWRKYKTKMYLKRHYTELLSKCSNVVLLSDKFKANLKAIIPNLDESKITSIPNPNTFDTETKCYDKRNIVLFVGRMDIGHKRPDRMLKIWKRVVRKFPDWELVMLGGGAALEAMKDRAKNIPNVRFTGFTDPAPFYKQAKILCMTSSYEGWGMVLTEAMAYGVIPMAFASYASVHEILRTPEQKVTPFSIDEYVKKLSNLMGNEDLQRSLVEDGYKIVAEYSVDNIVDKWEKIIRV